MNVRVIVQARTDSTRLPGKSLLPLCGMPSAVLAVKRASNRGHDVVLATTDRPLDDQLARVAGDSGVKVVRGNAVDVRRRFLDATSDLRDDDVIVRLTADNMIPDGDLVQHATEALRRTGALLVRSMADHRLPYGLAVEAMQAGSLRESVSWRDDAYAREHVTPALVERAGELPRFIDLGSDLGHLRCTLDTFADYLLLQELLEPSAEAVDVSWKELIQRLVSRPDTPPPRTPGPGMIVGTAQLTLPYGSVHKTEPPGKEEARLIVLRAARSRCRIDTAPGYGTAEVVIGEALRGGEAEDVRLTTKLDASVAEAAKDGAAETIRAEVSVLRSRLSLRGMVPDVLAHRPAQRTAFGGAVWDRLRQLQANGSIRGLGVSVYTPDEALLALKDPSVQILQIPFNVLDQRWVHKGVVAAVAERGDVEVHVRSVFLQGLLVRPLDAWPRLSGLEPSVLRNRVETAVKELGRTSAADLCIAYVRGHGLKHAWIDGIIIGVESIEQLRHNESHFGQAALAPDEVVYVEGMIGKVPDQLLDPSTWPTESG